MTITHGAEAGDTGDIAELDPDRSGPVEAASSGTRASSGSGRPPGPVKRGTQKWSRWLHVYTSMIALVVVLFFGVTGLTLNHPAWTFGSDPTTTEASGTLPLAVTSDDGTVDFLMVSEYAREELGVTGHIDSFEVVNGRGSIAYKNAGYSADLFFDVETGAYDLTIEQQGWLAVMNDLHKGRDTGRAWKWVIDVAAGFLVVISLTGLVMQFLLRKRRRTALASAAIGAVLVVILILVTLGQG